MKILLTNDDGIYADGIQHLATVLVNSGHQVAVIAPDRERSAAGHSITLNSPLRADKVIFKDKKNVDFFKIDGTPADCVKIGIEILLDFQPDLIISGINNGPNLGYDVLYSGTVSAAIEGWMMGYTAIAISLAGSRQQNFSQAAQTINDLIINLNISQFTEKILLNINLPDITKEEISGIAITQLTRCQYEDHYETRVDPLGKNYYWLTGEIKGEWEQNSDIWAIKNKRISITPLKLDLTNYRQKEQLETFLKN